MDEAGQVVPRPRKNALKPKQAALDVECATGEKSAQRVAQERGHEIIATAKNWEELRQLRRRTPKKKSGRRPRFEDWLRKRGLDYQAERWRYHETLEALPKEFRGAPTVLATPTREPHAAYAAYMRQILKDVPDSTPDRLNASIALQLRKAGFPREVVEDTLFQCAPQTWSEPIDRDWRRYAQRTTACAFSMEGDIRLARGLAATANQQQAEKEKAETQPRPQEKNTTSTIRENTKDTSTPVRRMRMR